MKSLGDMLPSGKFLSIVGSTALAGVLIVGAQYISTQHTSSYVASSAETLDDPNWRNTLTTIEGTSSPITAAPTPQEVEQALELAHTDNITQNVGRSLVITLSSAKQQGLGGDEPTQDSIINQAMNQVSLAPSVTYSTAQLFVVSDSDESLKTYGNEVMRVVRNHKDANFWAAMDAIAASTNAGDAKKLAPLPNIAKGYKALAHDLIAIPVPRSMASLQLLVVNNFQQIGDSVTNIETLFTDPLRGIVAGQQFNALINQQQSLFIKINDQLKKRSILFTKDEPGYAWSAFSASGQKP